MSRWWWYNTIHLSPPVFHHQKNLKIPEESWKVNKRIERDCDVLSAFFNSAHMPHFLYFFSSKHHQKKKINCLRPPVFYIAYSADDTMQKKKNQLNAFKLLMSLCVCLCVCALLGFYGWPISIRRPWMTHRKFPNDRLTNPAVHTSPD